MPCGRRMLRPRPSSRSKAQPLSAPDQGSGEGRDASHSQLPRSRSPTSACRTSATRAEDIAALRDGRLAAALLRPASSTHRGKLSWHTSTGSAAARRLLRHRQATRPSARLPTIAWIAEQRRVHRTVATLELERCHAPGHRHRARQHRARRASRPLSVNRMPSTPHASRPLHHRRHRGEDRLHVAAGPEAECRAPVVEQVELHIAAATHQLLIALGLSPRVRVVAYARCRDRPAETPCRRPA